MKKKKKNSGEFFTSYLNFSSLKKDIVSFSHWETDGLPVDIQFQGNVGLAIKDMRANIWALNSLNMYYYTELWDEYAQCRRVQHNPCYKMFFCM